MAIITISRGSFSHGKEIAEKVAKRLNYRVISREVLLETSQEFNVPEVKLLHAIKDAPSFLERMTYGPEKYIAFVQAKILKEFKKDNVVYHGFAGHFFVRGISHVLKTRIIADMEERVKAMMEREKIDNREKAINYIKRVDEERRKWSQKLYGIDTFNPQLYDILIHIKKLDVEEAVDIICHTVSLDTFKTTAESQHAIENLAKAAEIKALLVQKWPNIEVNYKDGTVTVKTTLPIQTDHRRHSKEIKKACTEIPGIKEIIVDINPLIPF